MASSLSNLVNNLSEGIHRKKHGHHDCEMVFILMNIWMIGKNSLKHYLKKKIFTEDFSPKYERCRLCAHKKSL